GRPGPRPAPRRLHLRDRPGAPPRPRRPAPRRTGDLDPGRLPPPACAVQDRSGPAGRARGRALARGVRRPRGGRQLGRVAPPRRPAERLPRPTNGGPTGLLREPAAAARGRTARHDDAAAPQDHLGAAGPLPPARRPTVPRRPGLRRRLALLERLPGAPRPVPPDARARPGTMARPRAHDLPHGVEPAGAAGAHTRARPASRT